MIRNFTTLENEALHEKRKRLSTFSTYFLAQIHLLSAFTVSSTAARISHARLLIQVINVLRRQIFFSSIDVNVIIPLKGAIIDSNTINLLPFSYVNRFSK